MVPIPRVVHQIWFGPHPRRAELGWYAQSWADHGYEMRLWTEANLPPLRNEDVYDEIARRGVNTGGGVPELGVWVQRADVVAYELAWRYGGIVANCDMECLRPLDPILDDVTAFAGREDADNVCNALIGCTQAHPFFDAVIDTLHDWYFAFENRGAPMNLVTGPKLLTAVARERDDLTVFDRRYFYPFDYLHMDREWDVYPDAYTRHHWGHTRGRTSTEPTRDGR